MVSCSSRNTRDKNDGQAPNHRPLQLEKQQQQQHKHVLLRSYQVRSTTRVSPPSRSTSLIRRWSSVSSSETGIIISEHEQQRNTTLSSSSPSIRSSPSSFTAGDISLDRSKSQQATVKDIPLRKQRSRISKITCKNLGGMGKSYNSNNIQTVDGDDSPNNNVVVIDFGTPYATSSTNGEDSEHDDKSTMFDLVAITGETGSGKSLLISKAVDLVTGGKASSSVLEDPSADHNESSHPSNVASVEMILSLDNDYLRLVDGLLKSAGVDPKKIFPDSSRNEANESGMTELKLRRDISSSSSPGNSSRTTPNRIKSSCFINDHQVTLKILRTIGVPLVALVNAPSASSSLGRPNARLSMIDTAVPMELQQWVYQLNQRYQKCKKYRQSLQRELDQQVLPISMMTVKEQQTNGDSGQGNRDEDLELLQHWTDELDGFESRMLNFRDSLAPNGPLVLEEDGTETSAVLLDLLDCDWESDSPNMYQLLLDLSESIKALDARIELSKKARDELCSLSTPDSGMAALERTRRYLIDAQMGGTQSSPSFGSKSEPAIEHAHDLLNQVEEAMAIWSSFMDDDEKGPTATLQTTRSLVATTTEQLAERITEWNTLARKHGIQSSQLPMCHAALKRQLDGGLEAKTLLPKAQKAESKALSDLQEGYRTLSKARKAICTNISNSITKRLPSLGFGNSSFEARLIPLKNPSYGSFPLGGDEVEFILHHDRTQRRQQQSVRTSTTDLGGGKLEDVASSGEKARILLAIECEIPGSVRELCGSSATKSAPSTTTLTSTAPMDSDSTDTTSQTLPPIAVIYDEIDAHVGGNASVAVAEMLLDQSRSCQVLSITHSPSVAAVADIHVCIQRNHQNHDHLQQSDQEEDMAQKKDGENDHYDSSIGRPFLLSARQVTKSDRTRELARILSGDMATDEAEAFAVALLREASSKKNIKQTTKKKRDE